MSRHEAVSCDSCLKGNFRGRRYKCLICYDYDLCAVCYENGVTTTRHTAEHPMQCILTRSDFDLYYGGEAITLEQPQSFTCPYCGKMGYTESTLQEHVTSEHADSSLEVVCPVCAASAGGDPNHVTDDFAAHLTLEHRSPRDLDETGNVRHLRRMFHPGRGIGQRTRRPNMHFSGSSGLSSGQGSGSPSSRETMDPIAELLSQLSGTRRVAGHSSTASQLQQLQIMQLQLERQQQQQQQSQQGTARQQVERLAVPRRQTTAAAAAAAAAASTAATSNSNPGHGASLSSLGATESASATSTLQKESQFLLSRIQEPVLSEVDQQSLEVENADRSFFLQDLILSTLNDDYCDSELDEPVLEGAIGGVANFDPPETLLQLESMNLRDKEGPA